MMEQCVNNKKDITTRNIRKVLREPIVSKKYIIYMIGLMKIQYCDVMVVLDGKPGQENKHDLPINGIKIIETLDNSDGSYYLMILILLK